MQRTNTLTRDKEPGAMPVRPKRRFRINRPAAMAVGAALLAAAGWYGYRMQQGRTAAAGQRSYTVTAVERAMVKRSVSATGTLQPWAVVDIKSKAGGRVDQLGVEVGDIVKKNQVLARIDPSDTLLTVRTARADTESAQAKESQSEKQYQLQIRQSDIAVQNAQAQLAAAQASLSAARTRLGNAQSQAKAQPGLTGAAIRQAQAGYDNARKQRQQLNSSQAQERASVQAAYDQAAANVENSKANLDRQNALLAKGFVSQQAVDQAQTTHRVNLAQLDSAKERLNTLAEQQRTQREASEAQVAQSLAQLESARRSPEVATRNYSVAENQAAVRQSQKQVEQAEANLREAKANRANNEIRRLDITTARATIARSKATLENAEDTLDQTVVRAPNDGVVLQKYVEQGTIITSGQSLNATGTSIVQLGDTTRMYVNVDVDETDIASVDVGQDVEVSVDAYPGVPYEGKVARIHPQAVVENNVTTFTVRVEIDNAAPTFRLLKPGMNSTCEFIVDSREDAVSVPTEAVQEDDDGSYVQIAHGGKMAPANPAAGLEADPNTLVGVRLEKRPVEVGLEGNDLTEITGGLQPGDRVVVQTNEPEAAQSSSGGGSAVGGSAFGGRGMGGGGRR